jgi:DNA replication protein DnaC
LEKNHSVIYLSSIRFFKILSHASFDKNYDNTGNRQLKEINNCDLLIIDDLGTELTNSFTISALFEQVNERILNNRSTIISTNMGFKELITTYTERVTSRFDQYYTYLNVIGDDIRQKI